MFVKLNQHSTSWWFCVTMTSVFSACILTVLVYPAYAALCTATCSLNLCASTCGTCSPNLGAGGYKITASVTAYEWWAEDDDCWGRVNAYHTVYVNNQSAGAKGLTIRYKALFRQENFKVGCSPTNPPWNERIEEVPANDEYSHTFTQSQKYKLSHVDTQCKYQGQAVTSLFIDGGGNADAQCPTNEFTTCPQPE